MAAPTTTPSLAIGSRGSTTRSIARETAIASCLLALRSPLLRLLLPTAAATTATAAATSAPAGAAALVDPQAGHPLEAHHANCLLEQGGRL